jgi:lipid-A-disaccharide synthase
MPETVMIVTGETSGELYGSLLAVSLKKRIPGIRIIGIGGERMQEAGVEIVSGIASAFGLAEAVSSLRAIKQTFAKASEVLKAERPGVLVLIDYPDFNLKLAALAKGLKVKILYYVSPQVWAWRRNRIKKIARLVDKMAVVLPFEEELYKDAGLECEFVGHPVFDEIQGMKIDKDAVKEALGLQRGRPLLSLLPGSRPHELERLLPLTLDVVRRFRKEFESFQFCIPLAPNTDFAGYSNVIDDLRREGVVINKGESLRVLAVSDMAVIASGTATLQAVLLGIPFVVMYKLFPLTYWLGKMIVRVKHISLVNILSGREVVKELLQAEASPEKIIHELRKIATDSQYREKMLDAFGRVSEMFSGKSASEKVADMVMEMAGWKTQK